MTPTATPATDYRDAVIRELADSEAALRADITILIELLADLTLENIQLRLVCERELPARIHGDATITRLRSRLHRRRAA